MNDHFSFDGMEDMLGKLEEEVYKPAPRPRPEFYNLRDVTETKHDTAFY